MANEEFKKSEKLAQMVMDILITDYFDRDRTKSNVNDKEYFKLIEWSLKDYESCGFDMRMYRIYSGIMEKQKEQKSKLESLN